MPVTAQTGLGAGKAHLREQPAEVFRILTTESRKEELIRHRWPIDTSGAYIPGHAMPTIILIGRNRPPRAGDDVFVVIGRRGEPAVPSDPALGIVWQSILRHVRQPGQTDEWTLSVHLRHDRLARFPWNLAAAET